ncbi:hypothetical protein RND81_06G066800 [Saponaria officinalis]|uniref:Uncharacterized protein n=1 Tax=Saponaria officinalis TaxID=3572 RepID=A0AAW1K4H0_SAPOF
MSMIMRDHKFNPNLFITDIDEEATRGKSKVFKWTDSQGRTFKLTAQEGHTVKASNSDTDREEEEDEEIVHGSSILGSESGDGSTVVPQTLVSPSVVESLKAGLESLVLDCNLDSEQLALLSSSFEINDKNSSAYFLSRFLSSISFHDAYEKHESKTLNEYIANVISRTEHDPIVEATVTVNIGTVEDPKELQLGASLNKDERTQFTELLTEYKDVFAWSYKAIPSIPRSIAKHRIPIKPRFKPIKQNSEWSRRRSKSNYKVIKDPDWT